MSGVRDDFLLPWSELSDAIERLAQVSGLSGSRLQSIRGASPHRPADDRVQERWIASIARAIGLEAVSLPTRYGDIDALLRSGTPLLFATGDDEHAGFIALVAGPRDRVRLLGRGGRFDVLSLDEARTLVCQGLEAEKAPEVEDLLRVAGVDERRRAGARAALFRQILGPRRIGPCWTLRCGAGGGLGPKLRQARVGPLISILLGVFLLQYAILFAGWWLLGRSALEGRLDRGWFWGWALLLATAIPFQVAASALMGELSIRIGVVLKQQLLKGALHLDPDAIRHQGVGELLGRVLESETIESLGLASSLLVLLSAIELIGAATILGAGAGGVLHVGLLASSVAISLVLGFHYLARWRSWTESRLTVTHGLVERMIGNRTRVAQESRDRWHEEEDQELARYLERSRALDTAHVMLTTFLPRVWFLLAIVGLAPAVVRGDGPDRVAVALGGILLAMLALRRLSTGILALAGARVALDTVSQLFESARTVEPGTLPLTLAVLADGASGGQQTGPLLRADRLHFRHHSRTEPVVRDASLSIRRGERLLLEGPSGAGKSTLASILCGLRVADGGLLALHGIDRQTLGGEEWRRRVAIAPQFHENHLFGATLAFNLLMGSRWPPAREDLRRAEELCRALGLGDLLAKMPAGIQQIVGETGWQLSHGERSRVYMARALLQEPELCVLDESFAALDVLTGQRALKAAIERVGTLVVIP